MPNSWILLEERRRGVFRVAILGDECQWHSIDLAQDLDDDQLGQELHEALNEFGYGTEPLALGLTSMNVYAASVHLDRGSHDSLAFELEELSPVAAEEMTATSVDRTGDTLGCWVPTKQYQGLLSALEQNGVHVRSISPTVLWVCQSLWQREKPCRALYVPFEDSFHLFQFEKERIIGWQQLPMDEDCLARELAIAGIDGEDVLVAAGESEESDCSIEDARSIEVNVLEEAAKFGARGLLRKEDVWIDLNRDELVTTSGRDRANAASQWLTAGVTAVVISLVVFAVILTGRLQNETKRLQGEQAQLFQELFPGEAVPVGIRRRLKIRADRLQATREAPVVLPERGVVLDSLYRLLKSMPRYAGDDTDMRYHIESIKISRQEVTVSGSVRDHGSAGQLATSISEQGFDVSPPKTETLSYQGVSLTLTASNGSGPEEEVAR